MTENRDQLRSGSHQFAGDAARLFKRRRPWPPLLEPEAVVLNVEQDALARKVQPLANRRLLAGPPVRKTRPTRKGGVEEGTQIGRKAKAKPAFGSGDFHVSEPNVEIDPVGIAAQTKLVLGSTKLVHQFSPITAIHASTFGVAKRAGSPAAMPGWATLAVNNLEPACGDEDDCHNDLAFCGSTLWPICCFWLSRPQTPPQLNGGAGLARAGGSITDERRT